MASKVDGSAASPERSTSSRRPGRTVAAAPPPPRRRQRSVRREEIEGYIAIAPWLIGFVVFTVGPIIASLVLSFTHYDAIGSPRWAGLANFRNLAEDPRFFQSLKVTGAYSALALPLGLVGGLSLSLMLNLRLPGINFFRTLFYLPSVIAGVAVSALWLWIYQPEFGLLNYLLGLVGIQGPDWLGDPGTALYALVMMSLWGIGGGAVIYLAGLQNIPPHLYDAAKVDGAGVFQRFAHITLPLLSPTIFFLLVTGVIGSFQVFTNVAILTRGGPEDSTLLYMYYLYQSGFQNFEFGYASAVAWIGAIISLVLALVVFRTQAVWVHYEAERVQAKEAR